VSQWKYHDVMLPSEKEACMEVLRQDETPKRFRRMRENIRIWIFGIYRSFYGSKSVYNGSIP
jgi:hypothetical protein